MLLKDHSNLSTFPVRAHFDDTKYKHKKPIPSNNINVVIEGFITEYNVDSSTGRVSLFHTNTENIGFPQKSTTHTGPPRQRSASSRTSARFKYNFDTTMSPPTITRSTPSPAADSAKKQPKRARVG